MSDQYRNSEGRVSCFSAVQGQIVAALGIVVLTLGIAVERFPEAVDNVGL